MSEIHIVRDYPHPPAKVWRAVTDPALVPLWTVTGAGGRPEGFAPVVGTKFRLLARPKPGWRAGVGGVFMTKLLGHVRRKMLRAGLPPVLDDLDEDGTLRPGSTLRPKSLG